MKPILLVFLAILCLTAACSPAQPEMLVLTAEQVGQTIALQQGQTFQVSLEGNPTTGYNWIMAPQDPVLVEQQGEPAFEAASDLVGSPGTLTYILKAVAVGEGALHFDYKRPWEKEAQPEKTFEVTVIVK